MHLASINPVNVQQPDPRDADTVYGYPLKVMYTVQYVVILGTVKLRLK
jgi:hypothetical protein